MKKFHIVTAIGFLVASSVTHAKPRFMSQGYLSGHDLVMACQATLTRSAVRHDKSKVRKGRSLSYFCSGYVLGYSSAEAALQADSDIYGLYQKAFCLPDDVSQLEIVRGIHNALSQYKAKRLDQPVSLLMKPAFIDAFPCEKRGTTAVIVDRQKSKPSTETLIGPPPGTPHVIGASSSAWVK